MDLSKLLTQSDGVLSTSVRHGSNSSEDTLNEDNTGVEKEGQWRDRMYKRKNMNFDSTSNERRTLKSMKVTFVN